MFTALLVRQGPAHIVNWFSTSSYITICGKTYHKHDRINTVGADDTFPGICRACKEAYDQMYHSDLENFPTSARSVPGFTQDTLAAHKADFLGPKAMYEDFLKYKLTFTLIKYQRLIQRRTK